jgi:2-haloacid dehalogenase
MSAPSETRRSPAHSSIHEVEALVFDVFGTVVDWRTSIVDVLERFGADRSVERDWSDFADRWRARYQPSLEEVRSGEREWVPLDVLHRENLLALLAEHRIYGLSAAEVDALNQSWHQLDPWPDVCAAFDRLRPRVELIALSNADRAMAAAIADHGRFRWDRILGAEPVRAYKPCPEVYLHACQATGLRPDQILMVAAHNRDLEAAHALGFRTAFIRRPHEHGPGQTTDLTPSGPWDVVADNLHALADHFDPGPPLDRTSPAAEPSLGRTRLAALAVVIALCTILAFSQGYRVGSRQSIANTPGVHGGP